MVGSGIVLSTIRFAFVFRNRNAFRFKLTGLSLLDLSMFGGNLSMLDVVCNLSADRAVKLVCRFFPAKQADVELADSYFYAEASLQLYMQDKMVNEKKKSSPLPCNHQAVVPLTCFLDVKSHYLTVP